MVKNPRDHGLADDSANTKSVFQKILDKAGVKVPASSEFGEVSDCMICHEAFLTGSSPEGPMKLPCGHIIGSHCSLKWFKPFSISGNNSCPVCRVAVFRDPPVTSHRASEATTNEVTEQPARSSSSPILRRPFNRQHYDYLHRVLSPGPLNDADEESYQKILNLAYGDRSNPEHPLHDYLGR